MVENSKVEEEWTIDSILTAYYPKDTKLQNNIKGLLESAIEETNDFVIETTTKNRASNTKIIVPRGITLSNYGAYDNEIKCSVWGKEYGNSGQWIKIYKTADYTEFLEVAWLTEIYFQNLAHSLNGGCKFTSPKVNEYGTFSLSGDTFFYIIMEHVPEFSGKMSKSDCVSIAEKVFASDRCLRGKGLFHNDLRPANVFNRDGELVIIDYGEADNIERDLGSKRDENSFIESCAKLAPEQPDIPPVTPSPPTSPMPEGGGTKRKRNKKRKTQRKRKRNKTKRRHKK
jgi:serine/threonine protein kinase